MGEKYLDKYNHLKHKFHNIFKKSSKSNNYSTVVEEVIEFAEGLKLDEANNELWTVKEWFLTQIINLGDNVEIEKIIEDKIRHNGIDIINVAGVKPPTEKEIIKEEATEATEAIEQLSSYFDYTRGHITIGALPIGNIPNTPVDLRHPDIKHVYRFLIENVQIEYVPLAIFKEILLGKSQYKLTYKGTFVTELLIVLHALNRLNLLGLNEAFYQRIITYKGTNINFNKNKADPKRVDRKSTSIRLILDTYKN